MRLKKNFIFIIVFILMILLILTFRIIDNTKDKNIQLDFDNGIEKLSNFNSDNYYKIGWLQVQGTNINLPILDFSSSYEDLDYSFGWRSASFVTGENREVLLGHNILNVSSNPMLSNENLDDFESLMSFSYAGFAKDNLYIEYSKDGKNEIYLIYAVGFYDYSYDDSSSYNETKDIKKYIENTRKNSIYDYDIDVVENDSLITLKTCTRYFGIDEKQQFVVDARKLREDEKTIKYKVTTNELFNKLMNSSKID